MAFSSLTAIDLIPEQSLATPGLFNHIFSQISDNVGTINQGGVPFNVASGSTWASIGLFANSSNSDYLRLKDSSGQRSTYRIGSAAGGTADGLNIFDESGNTMIVSFSKQSIRFYQNIVGPVFDVGGSLTATLNAGAFGTGADSKESRIQAAINAASNQAVPRVYVPASMYPYSASSVSFIYPVQMTREGGDPSTYDVKAYGAAGTSTVVAGAIVAVDDLAAFNACREGAHATNGLIRIPAVAGGLFYSLSTTWLFQNYRNLRIQGDGVQSILVINNAAGANCITLDGSVHAYISGIGLSGISGSGHGIEIANDSHWPLIADVTAAWMGGNGFHVSGGIDARFDHCDAWQDAGYDPAVLGLLRGNTAIGFCVTTNATGHTNNVQCIGCQSEACLTYALKVGATTDTQIVGSFTWLGGLIEGTQSYTEVYMRCTDGKLHPSHVESKVAVSRSVYGVTLDRCTNAHLSETVVTCDVLLTGCQSCSVSRMRTPGVVIDETCVNCWVADGYVGSDTVGPSTGQLVDLGLNTKIERIVAANVPTGGYGYRSNSKIVAVTTGRSWNGTAVEGWTSNGGPTLSQVVDGSGNATIRLQITSAGFSQFLRKFLGPIEMIRGKWITVDARILVADKTKPFLIFGDYDGGAATSSFGSFTDTISERICAAFYIAPTRTLFAIELSGINGADIKISELQIAVSDFASTNIDALGTGATPGLGDNGYMLPAYTDPGSATAITGFTNAERGKPFTILFTAARTLTNSATLILAGAVNFVAKNGDTMTLVYDGANAVFREVARMVS